MSTTSKRTSIYLSESINKIRNLAKKNFSARLSNICDRYITLIENSFPDDVFIYPELCLLREVLKDVTIKDAKLIQNQTISFHVKNHIKLDAVDKKYEVDSKKLLEKIDQLSYIQVVSLIEHIEKHWINNSPNS